MRTRTGLVALIVPALLCAIRAAGAQVEGATPPRILAIDRADLRLMPLPVAAEISAGSLDLRRGLTTVGVRCGDARVARALVRFGRQLSQMRPRVPGVRAGRASFTVSCARRVGSVQLPVEDESYSLTVRPLELSLSAQTPYGVLRGLETILQLVERTDTTISLPALTIEDRPRYPWRGLMIDVSRHWMPKSVILRNLDAMAAVKLNVLHLHLTDDQGFRVESQLFPRLHQEGSGGNYYTQDDIREIVGYAADRGIRVVPEFDLPGHATSWLVGYPMLGSGRGPYSLAREYGIRDATLDPTREEVYEFLDSFFREMARLFPDPFVHIGGDEVSAKSDWNTNPRVQRFMRDHRLEGNHALQAYFNQRLQTILRSVGKAPVGWDEILHDSLKTPVVIQAWRSQEKLFEAVHRGFGGLLSAGWYLDHKLPAADLYRVDPTRLRDVVTIVPDSTRWKTWSIRVRAGESVLDGRLALFGPSEHPTGALEIAGTVRPITTGTVSGDTLRLALRAQDGSSMLVGIPRADSLTGTIGMFGFNLPFAGKRTGGSDMPGSAFPVFEPVAPLTPESEKRIVGGEAAMWSEAVSAGTIDSRIWPRSAAIAEKLWTPAELTDDVGDMYRRLDHVSTFLTMRGVTHESAYPAELRDLLGSDADVTPLRTLVDALEEVKFYGRMAYNPAQLLEPELRSLADVARPESRSARRFAARVDAFLADTARRAEVQAIRAQLVLWRDNHARLAPMLGSAKQAQDIRALSERLAAASTIGLTALDALERKQPLPAADLARYKQELTAAATPRAAVMSPAIPAIQKLIDRAGSTTERGS
ncbi:MAG: beta-N-acetylhexosaminidase [Gemmatimonadaceae bacterium]